MRNLLIAGALLIMPMTLIASCSPAPPAPMVTPAQSGLVTINLNAKTKVDLLFMVDNSPSMGAMQQILTAGFFEFFRPFDDLTKRGQYIDFHIGVVTSDYGAGATGAPGCDISPGGQKGILQARGIKAPGNCNAPVGTPFIQYSTAPMGPNNLPVNQDLPTTFTCMASVGAIGCGFEHQLESVYAALRNNNENGGFMRPDAALAVAFLTNEDDASAPPDTDVFDKNKVAQYGYEDSYSRQTRFAIVCCPPGQMTCKTSELTFPPYGSSSGALAGCRAAPNPPGRQFDVNRYIEYFTRPAAKGGVKALPEDVILYAIAAPELPVEVILSNPGTSAGQPYVPCVQLNENSKPACVPVLQHSCQNMASPELFGDPAIRLNTVVRSVANHRIWSICDNDYGGALQKLGTLVSSQLGGGCLPDEPFAGVGANQVSCEVADVKNDVDSETATPIPQCTNNVFPCWRIEAKETCVQQSAQSLGLTLDRNGQMPPMNTHVRAGCAKMK